MARHGTSALGLDRFINIMVSNMGNYIYNGILIYIYPYINVKFSGVLSYLASIQMLLPEFCHQEASARRRIGWLRVGLHRLKS